MKKTLISVLTAALMLSSIAFADYDPIDEAQIYSANYSGVTIPHNSTALFARLYAAKYDDDGRLIDVSSAPIEYTNGEFIEYNYTYSSLGIDENVIDIGTKLMLWSTYTSDMRPAQNTCTIEKTYYTAASYGTANNNPTMVVKKVFSNVNDFGETEYIVVGYSNGGEVRYTSKASTLVAKMTAQFNGSRYYIGEELWRADMDMGTEFTDLIQPGDIVGVQDGGAIFMIMTDAQELIDGVKSGDIPDLYNMRNMGVSAARDSIIMGGVESVEINEDFAFVSAQDYKMGMDISRCIDVVNVSENGEVTVDDKNIISLVELEPFDAETGKGDYLFARYANKGSLQEVYVYRFE